MAKYNFVFLLLALSLFAITSATPVEKREAFLQDVMKPLTDGVSSVFNPDNLNKVADSLKDGFNTFLRFFQPSEWAKQKPKREADPRGDMDPVEQEVNDILERVEGVIQNDEQYEKFHNCFNNVERTKRRGDIDPLQDRRDFMKSAAVEAASDVVAYDHFDKCYDEATA